MIREKTENGYVFSTDKARIDVTYVHHYLSTQSYWAKNIPLAIVEQSIRNSECFAIYGPTRQVSFARLITDYATFGYLADVFVDEKERGKGLSKALMHFIFEPAEIKGMRRLMLGTHDAHGLYAQFNFKSLAHPGRFMELHRPDVYATQG